MTSKLFILPKQTPFLIRYGFSLMVPLLLVLILKPSVPAATVPDYPDDKRLAKQIKDLTRSHKKLIRSSTLAESLDGRDVMLLDIGFGKDEDRAIRPAMLLVAGLEGNDLAGTASAMNWVAHLASQTATNPAVQSLLETTTLYVIPRLNPDAAASYFAKPRFETRTNGRPTDEDHDGLVDEDGPEDLNGDGMITWMRVEDPEGEYFLDPSEPRLLIKADRIKGEKGAWRLLTEGKDNDEDEAWNEDGLGGVNFNRNFPYRYEFFGPTAGRHQMSELETRALADFIVEHSNIGIVFAYGEADNLVKEPKSEEGGKRPPTAIHADDAPYYREAGKLWREAIGLKKELSERKEPGTFSDWMYFHRGRFSLAAQAWSPALQLELAKNDSKKEPQKKPKDEGKEKEKDEGESKEEKSKAEDKADAKGEDKKPEPDKRNEEERNFLSWADTNAPALFAGWQPYEHSDFPDRKVEIGGFVPFAKSNPPGALLGGLMDRQAGFLTDLAGKLPRLALRRTELKALGDSVFDLTVTLENTGYLPTAMAQGDTSRQVFPTRIVLEIPDTSLLTGTRRVNLGTLSGSGGVKEARWVFLGKDLREVTFESVSMLGGSLRVTLDLKEAK